MALKRYFYKLPFDLARSRLWADVRLGIDMEMAEFLDTIRPMLKEKFDAALFPKALQKAKDTSTVGFLLYSHPTMNPSRMQKHLSKLIGKEVAVRTKKFVKKGAFRSQVQLPAPQCKEGPWFIEVAENDLLEVRPWLSKAFSSKKEHRPMFS